MAFRRGRALHPVVSTKNVSEISSIIAAVTSTVSLIISDSVDAPVLSELDEVERGSTINGFFFSCFFYTEGGEVANEVPLVDWYIIKNPGNSFANTFDATNLPTPGATGTHVNKRYIIHTEKGLAGGGDAALNGVPMVFKGVIVVPKHMCRQNSGDRFILCTRTNFATKFCAQAIYKWYH